MAGLNINKKRNFRIGRWLFAGSFIVLLGASGWYGYQWYVTGDQPPVVPLPASALADPTVDESRVTINDIQNYTVPGDYPRYISIPALNVSNARVQVVGLTKNAILDTPKNISDTAWYDKSARPGQGYGAVLINGHNGGISRDGIFANLASLVKDDEIIVERGDGKKITYVVKENRTETLAEANATGMKRLMLPLDPSREGLSLITCAGKWIPRDKVFDMRIMIRAIELKS